jgi:WD40-like Beta Propeller Repeat
VSFIKIFCIQKVVKAKPTDAAKYPVIRKEAVRKSLKDRARTNCAGFLPLDIPPSGRHPDCPLGPSLVVSRIAPTSQASTYSIGVRTLLEKSRLTFCFLIFVMLVMSSCQQTINFPAPTITSLSPTSVPAGSPQTILRVLGKNLVQQAQVGFALTANGSPTPLATFQFVGINEIDATLPATLLQNPSTLFISVTTPQPGGGTFPPTNQPPPSFTIFTVSAVTSGVPQVTSINPADILVGTTNGLTLHIAGKNFVSQSEVFVNGANRSTTFINSTSLAAQLSPTDVVLPGALQITVLNPSPGGGGSTPFALPVDTPVPVISALSPVNAQAGGTTAIILSVAGTGFLNQYTNINVNGVPFATTVAGSTSASATLTPNYLLPGGVDQITVVNAGPGGGTSDILTFAVNPTHLLGLPVLVDLAADGSQAIGGLCGGVTSCSMGSLGLTTATVGPSTSNTGQFVAFASASHNLVLTDLNAAADVYVRNTCLGVASCSPVTALVSSDPNGNAANGVSSEPTVSSDGTRAAFTSLATNLVSTVSVPSGPSQVYWRPVCMPTSTTPCTINPSSNFDSQLVSISADGQSAGNGRSYNPVISPDGQYVAFVSLATNLVTDITADGITPQVYIRNTCNITTIQTTTPGTCVPTTYLVSTPDGAAFGNGASSSPSISEDGLFVSFTSTAKNLLGANNTSLTGAPEIFERSTCVTTIASTDNTCTPVTMLISTPDGTTPADNASDQSSVSSCGSQTVTTGTTACAGGTVFNGRFVAFASTATTLIPGIGPTQEIYVRDTCLGITATTVTCVPSTILASTKDGTTPANGLSEHPSVSLSGQFIAFSSLASNLGNTSNGVENIFVRNSCLGITISCTSGLSLSSISAGTNASPTSGASLRPSISGDGHTVSFLSFAPLAPADRNALDDIYLGSTTY